MTISQIEKMTYKQARKKAIERIEIKGHTVIFMDCGEYFGYSALVFKSGRHIYHANEYELHYSHFVKENGKDALRQKYIDILNRKLYTNKELYEPIKSYDEYQLKSRFLRNYWIMRYKHKSCFAIDKEDKEAIERAKRRLKYFCPTCWCYVGDPNIVDDAYDINEYLQAEYKRISDDLDVFRSMIAYELSNHEACITCSYTETLDSLGLKFERLSKEKQKIVLKELDKQIRKYTY